MELKLTNEESELFFYNSLCNGLGYMSGYGLELVVDDSSYKNAKENLQKKNNDSAICYEDVLMQILRDGGNLIFNDVEEDGEYTRSITMNDVHERVPLTPAEWLIQMRDEEDDAETADAILQTVFYQEIIFG